MKLNPKKCVLEVQSGKFLRFMISSRGIEANPDKIQAVLDMKPLRNIREVQRSLWPSNGSCLDPLTSASLSSMYYTNTSTSLVTKK